MLRNLEGKEEPEILLGFLGGFASLFALLATVRRHYMVESNLHKNVNLVILFVHAAGVAESSDAQTNCVSLDKLERRFGKTCAPRRAYRSHPERGVRRASSLLPTTQKQGWRPKERARTASDATEFGTW